VTAIQLFSGIQHIHCIPLQQVSVLGCIAFCPAQIPAKLFVGKQKRYARHAAIEFGEKSCGERQCLLVQFHSVRTDAIQFSLTLS
jgi:hypothetical protein